MYVHFNAECREEDHAEENLIAAEYCAAQLLEEYNICGSR